MEPPTRDGRCTLELTTEPRLGGRWTSLLMRRPAGSGREWLWRNPREGLAAARREVDQGSGFVDAGGGEECFPSIREPWDHGLIWNRPWTPVDDGWEEVAAAPYRLARRVTRANDGLAVDYRAEALEAAPALHATHLLLDLSPGARLLPAGDPEPVFFDERPDAEIARLGSTGAFVERFGDGAPGASCYALPGCRELTVADGDDALTLRLESDDDLPLGFVIWRNLGGWPDGAPYRSLGVEPGWGHGLSLPAGGVVLRPGRPVAWRLLLEGRTSA